MLELKLQGGAIVYAEDKSSGEILVNTSAWVNRPSVISGDFPISKTTPVSFQKINSTLGRLNYSISLEKSL